MRILASGLVATLVLTGPSMAWHVDLPVTAGLTIGGLLDAAAVRSVASPRIGAKGE